MAGRLEFKVKRGDDFYLLGKVFVNAVDTSKLNETKDETRLTKYFEKLSEEDAEKAILSCFIENLFICFRCEFQKKYEKICKLQFDVLRDTFLGIESPSFSIEQQLAKDTFKTMNLSINDLVTNELSIHIRQQVFLSDIIGLFKKLIKMDDKTKSLKKQEAEIRKTVKNHFCFIALAIEPIFIKKLGKGNLIGEEKYMEFIKKNFFKNKEAREWFRGRNSFKNANLASIKDTMRRYREEYEINQISLYLPNESTRANNT